MVADAVPWIPDAIYSAWRWTPPQMRERLYERTLKIVQSWESRQQHIENLEAVLQHEEERLEEMKKENDRHLETVRQALEQLKLAV